MLAIGLLILGIISRLITHVPNFTPVIALSLFSGVYLRKGQAVIFPLVLLAITDLILGFHVTMAFTYLSVFLISLIGFWLKDHKNIKNVTITSLYSSILFFVITNFGVWLVSGLYPLTAAGFKDCFVLAIPFFKTELFSTILYTVVFFGAYELIASRVKNTRFAHVL